MYPSHTESYKITSNNKSEEISLIIVDWYKKFLSGEIQRERTNSVGKGDSLVINTFLEKVMEHVKNLHFENRYTEIFATDYGPEKELRKIYKESCEIHNEKPFDWSMKVPFPVKWLVYYLNEELYIS